jgi:hypothetical protein
MIAITAVIVISFSVWGGWTKGGRAARGRTGAQEDTAFSIFGRDYNLHDMGRLQRTQMLSYYIGMYDLLGLASVAEQLKTMDGRGPNYDFVANLLVLREKSVEFGVAASDEDARKKLESLPQFQKEGKFDENAAAEMEMRLGMQGFSKEDMLQIAKDAIAYERLQDIVGANISPSPLAVSKGYASNQQTLKASLVTLAIDDFKKKAEVKDEEISKYYDEKKDGYKTPEKRAGVYVVFEKPKPDDKKKAEENAKAQTDFENLVNEFDQKFKAPGSDFNLVVAEFQKKNPAMKLQTLALFEKAKVPDAIKDETKVVEELFRPTLESGKHSEPVEGTKGYYFLKVTQIEAPKQQELKDVKDKIKEALVSQKAQEALVKAANEARTALLDGLKAGKKLDAIAKDKALKVEALPDFSPTNPPPDKPALAKLGKEAGNTPAGGVTKPESDDKGATMVVVTAKELRKSDQAASLKTSEETSQANELKQGLFKSWFSKVRTEANMRVVQG